MYKNDDLEFLKSEYMKQDYPEDLNDHILTCIADASLNLNSKKIPKRYNIYTKLVLVACLCIAVFSVFKSRDIDINIEQNEIPSTRNITPGPSSLLEENSTYMLSENEFIISIYPSNKEITIEDKIYNIDKITGNIIELKDILIDDIGFIEIEDVFRNVLQDKDSKFYIDYDGMYVIIGHGGSIRIDDSMKYKIFKK